MCLISSAKFLLPLLLLSQALFAKAEELLTPIQRIQQKGELVVALHSEDAPPFFMRNTAGKLIGIDPYIAEKIASHLGVALRFDRSAVTYDDLVNFVERRQVDVAISLLSNTLERAQRVVFSNSYANIHPALLFNRLQLAKFKPTTPRYKVVNSPNIKLGVVAGTAYLQFAQEEFPNAQVIEYNSWHAAVQALLKGEALAAMYDETEISNWNAQKDNKDILYLQSMIIRDRTDSIAIAIHRDDLLLLHWINLLLEKMELQGELPALRNQYLSHDNWRAQ